MVDARTIGAEEELDLFCTVCVYVRVKAVPLNSGCGVHRFKSYICVYAKPQV